MNYTFPLSPAISSSQAWYSLEHKSLMLTDFVLEQLLNGRSLKFVYTNENDLDGLDNFIGLQQLSSSSSGALDQFFNKLRKIHSIVKLLKNAGSNKEQAIFGSQGFWELASLFLAQGAGFQDTSWIQGAEIEKQFDSQEYKRLKSIISKVKSLYTPALVYHLEKSDLQESCFLESEHKGELVAAKYIASFLDRLQASKRTLDTFFQSYISEQTERFSNLESKITEAVQQWREMRDGFGFKPKEKFLVELKSMLKELSQLSGEKSGISAVDSVEIVEELLLKCKHKFDLKLNKECKAMNVRNTGDSQLAEVQLDIAELVKDINASQLFKEEVYMNSLSLQFTAEALATLEKQLNNAIFELRADGELYNWFSFYNVLSENDKWFVEGLIETPQAQWQSKYDAWFLRGLLEQHGLSAQEELFQHLLDLQEQWESIRFDFGEIASEVMKENNTQIDFVKYTGGSDYSEDWTYVLLGEAEQLLSGKMADLQLPFLGLKPKEKMEINESFLLHESLINAIDDEEDLEAKLTRSKLLATYFIEDANYAELILTAQTNIIIDSRYTDVAELVEAELGKGKRIKMRENAFKVFTEFFLDSSKDCYYFYDQTALRFSSESDVYKHLSKIKALQYAGYYTIAVDRCKLHDSDYKKGLMSFKSVRANA